MPVENENALWQNVVLVNIQPGNLESFNCNFKNVRMQD